MHLTPRKDDYDETSAEREKNEGDMAYSTGNFEEEALR